MNTFLIRHKAGIIPEMILYYDKWCLADYDPIDFNTIDFSTIQEKVYNIKAVNEPDGTRRQWWLIEATYKG